MGVETVNQLNIMAKKVYILDTNILIHNPEAATSFDDAHVRVPVEVIQELDRIKTEESDRGRAARAATRTLIGLLGVNVNPMNPAMLAGGGTIAILVPPANKASEEEVRVATVVGNVGGDTTAPDNRIIAAALREQGRAARGKGTCVLVTKDMTMAIKAMAAGLAVEDYRHDKVAPEEARTTKTAHIPCSSDEIHNLNTLHQVVLQDQRCGGLKLNEYVVLDGENGHGGVPARYVGRDVVQALHGANGFLVPGGKYFKPLNLEQYFLLDALLDPSIELVTICGQAGTGKTILSLAASLYLIGQGVYGGISITRPTKGVADEIGFLPGSLEEKMQPWMQGYSDAAANIFSKKPPLDKPQSDRKARRVQGSPKSGAVLREPRRPGLAKDVRVKPFDELIASGILEIQAMTFIRGRSIPDGILVLDEAQNTNSHQIKTVVTRIAQNGKLIVSGDPAQIDNPWVDERSNGLVYLRSRMNNLSNVAHVVLRKGERSPLAELAAKML